jgi:EAL domain-containing protein (putative c-di-GMP-specific phosphodiesterase class I)
MCDIDAWVLNAACADLARWLRGRAATRPAGGQPERAAGAQPGAVGGLRDAMERHGLHPTQLELEITEDAFIHDPDGVPRALARWRQLGLALTIDDFGVGYSSLSQLKTLRPERLKIDCSLVRACPTTPKTARWPRPCWAWRAPCTSKWWPKGVETAAQRRWLLEHDCPRQQGHLHGQPMPAALFEAWLSGMTAPAPLALA